MANKRHAAKCAARGGMTRGEVVAAVFERDGYKCVKCGMTDDDHIAETGRSLQVHRLIPGKMYHVDGCSLRCRECHGPEPKRPAGQCDEEGGSGFMVRLPETYRDKLRTLTERTKRKITAEVQVALDKHFKAEKIE